MVAAASAPALTAASGVDQSAAGWQDEHSYPAPPLCQCGVPVADLVRVGDYRLVRPLGAGGMGEVAPRSQ